jgi:hypothetical protein
LKPKNRTHSSAVHLAPAGSTSLSIIIAAFVEMSVSFAFMRCVLRCFHSLAHSSIEERHLATGDFAGVWHFPDEVSRLELLPRFHTTFSLSAPCIYSGNLNIWDLERPATALCAPLTTCLLRPFPTFSTGVCRFFFYLRLWLPFPSHFFAADTLSKHIKA